MCVCLCPPKKYFLGLLRETAKPEARETFSNVNSTPQGVDSGKLSPSHGFQRDLVRVIGNMCYKHTANQNKASSQLGLKFSWICTEWPWNLSVPPERAPEKAIGCHDAVKRTTHVQLALKLPPVLFSQNLKHMNL